MNIRTLNITKLLDTAKKLLNKDDSQYFAIGDPDHLQVEEDSGMISVDYALMFQNGEKIIPVDTNLDFDTNKNYIGEVARERKL